MRNFSVFTSKMITTARYKPDMFPNDKLFKYEQKQLYVQSTLTCYLLPFGKNIIIIWKEKMRLCVCSCGQPQTCMFCLYHLFALGPDSEKSFSNWDDRFQKCCWLFVPLHHTLFPRPTLNCFLQQLPPCSGLSLSSCHLGFVLLPSPCSHSVSSGTGISSLTPPCSSFSQTSPSFLLLSV